MAKIGLRLGAAVGYTSNVGAYVDPVVISLVGTGTGEMVMSRAIASVGARVGTSAGAPV